jgi:hypothetical protein
MPVGAALDELDEVVRSRRKSCRFHALRRLLRRRGGHSPPVLPSRPAADERQRKGKTIAQTRLVPVRLTVVGQEDMDAMVAGVGAVARREIRLRRLTQEAYGQGGVLSEADLSLVTGYTDGGVSTAVIRLRKAGEILPIRGYVADMGSWPTHKAAIVRLYLEGLTTPEIANRTHHAKKSVDRYIEGFERVRLLDAKHPREELPLLTGLAPASSPNTSPSWTSISSAPSTAVAECEAMPDHTGVVNGGPKGHPAGTEAKRRPLTTPDATTATMDNAPPTGRGLQADGAARSAAHLTLFGAHVRRGGPPRLDLPCSRLHP